MNAYIEFNCELKDGQMNETISKIREASESSSFQFTSGTSFNVLDAELFIDLDNVSPLLLFIKDQVHEKHRETAPIGMLSIGTINSDLYLSDNQLLSYLVVKDRSKGGDTNDTRQLTEETR